MECCSSRENAFFYHSAADYPLATSTGSILAFGTFSVSVWAAPLPVPIPWEASKRDYPTVLGDEWTRQAKMERISDQDPLRR